MLIGLLIYWANWTQNFW